MMLHWPLPHGSLPRAAAAALEEAGEDKAEVESANPRLPALLDAYGPMSTGTAKLGEGDSSLSTQMLQVLS